MRLVVIGGSNAGISGPQVDGLVLKGRRLWAVQNTNQVTRILLDRHLAFGAVEKVITSDLFQTPSTAARFGRRLAPRLADRSVLSRTGDLPRAKLEVGQAAA